MTHQLYTLKYLLGSQIRRADIEDYCKSRLYICVPSLKIAISFILSGSSGSVVFSDLPPGSYVVRVVADNGRNDRAIERRRFDITGDSSTCTVHLINDGVTVDGNRVLVEFAGTGTVQVFSCQLRGQDAFSCELTLR